MITTKATLCWIALALPLAAVEEIAVTPHVDSVGLFKNGVAVVHASFEAKTAGTYRWDKLPDSVHGSLWVESGAAVTLRSTTRLVAEDKASAPSTFRLQEDLAGKAVTLRLKSDITGGDNVVAGTVRTLARTPMVWTRDFTPAGAWSSYYNRSNPGAVSPEFTNFLLLEDSDGRMQYVDLNSIVQVSVQQPGAIQRQVEKPVVLFEVSQAPAAGQRVEITYLARGLAWAPSYRLELGDDQQLTLRRSAVVRNELTDLQNTDVQLISGFPNVQFAATDSLLSGGSTLASFFQALSSQERGGAPGPMTQQMVMYNSAPMGGAGGGGAQVPDLAEQGSEGDDQAFESIGKRTLAPGDALSMELGSAKTGYERVVEWVVPDGRDEYGSYSRSNGQKEDEPWDALKFVNPFKFPMTTAPAMITDGGRFRGQSQSQWVNPGQSTCLRVTKALSIQTRYSETEEEEQREQIWIGGRTYQRTKVKGELTVHNFRNKETVMNIRTAFSGELLEADAAPQKRLKAEGARSVNPRRELEWALKVGPGEEKTLSYRYSVLVAR